MKISKPLRWAAFTMFVLTGLALAYLADTGGVPQAWSRWSNPVLIALAAWLSPFHRIRTPEGGFPFSRDAK
ncbi:hypothetical protein [Rhodoferax sp.]|uniref:hypothetical protein n=1 Tax=Rhodoferax sp. TaxID=50421 RepID=UPI0027794FDF|nr:hypothetical protein [Rhodoferax sp.]